MIMQARFPYALRFSLRVPLARSEADPSEAAIDHYLVELLHLGSDGEEELVARAIVYRVRRCEVEDVLLVADADGYTALLEQVCAEALEPDGTPNAEISRALEEVCCDPIVLDSIDFIEPLHDAPVVRGLVGRAILETLGRGMEVMFLPGGAREFSMWERALGAVRVAGFTVASAALEPPEFPPATIMGECN